VSAHRKRTLRKGVGGGAWGTVCICGVSAERREALAAGGRTSTGQMAEEEKTSPTQIQTKVVPVLQPSGKGTGRPPDFK
jgi:hypothetical protein